MSDIENIKLKVKDIADRQEKINDNTHRLEIELVGMKNNIETIKESQDKLNNGLAKVLYIIGGGFILSVVTFVVKGGLSN